MEDRTSVDYHSTTPPEPLPQRFDPAGLFILVVLLGGGIYLGIGVLLNAAQFDVQPWLKLLLTIAGLVAIPMIVAPIGIYSHFRVNDSIYPVMYEHGELPEYVAQTLDRHAPAMAKLGFTVDGYAKIAGQVPNIATYLSVWRNEESADSSVVAIFLGLPWPRELIAFETDFSDGTRVATDNMKDANSFVADPRRDKLHVSWIDSPTKLYQIHRRRVDNSRKGRGILPSVDAIAETIYLDGKAEFAGQVTAGRLQCGASPGELRTTAYGAILMAWGQIWPITSVRKYLRKRRTFRRLQELGFNSDGT